LDLVNITDKPNINDLPYVEQYNVSIYRLLENGSRTLRQGIQFGYQPPRFIGINTRITVTGAWFKTLYDNSTPHYERPSQSIGGISFPYVGIYNNDLGYINSGLNYNAIIDKIGRAHV